MNATLPQPFDVKLMNLTATVLFAACAAMLLAALSWWALRHPLFALGGITVQGEVSHNSAATLRANVAPRVAGNFFTVNLEVAREAFQDVPWVRQAVVRREFPNRLRVLLQEHHAAAYWGAEGEAQRLVNTYGEVFDANAGDVEQDNLPRLAGPDGESETVLAMYQVLQPLFEGLDLGTEQLTLNGRGSWQLALDNGAQVELGRGTPDEVALRAQRFVQTLGQAASKYGRRATDLVSADLRHSDGYAIRLRGVSTTGADATQKK